MGGGGVSAAAGGIDETQLNRAVAADGKVADGYGIRFPREFALLIKQVLYFDRYTQLLAPGLDVLNDERLSMNSPSPSSATPVVGGADGEIEDVVVDVVEVSGPTSDPLTLELHMREL